MPVYIITPFGLKLQCNTTMHCGTIAKSVKPLYPAKIGLNGHYVPDFQQPRLKRKSQHDELQFNTLQCSQNLKNSKARRKLDFNDESIIEFEFVEEADAAELIC